MAKPLVAIGTVFVDSVEGEKWQVVAHRKIRPEDTHRLNQLSLNNGELRVIDIAEEPPTRLEYIVKRCSPEIEDSPDPEIVPTIII